MAPSEDCVGDPGRVMWNPDVRSCFQVEMRADFALAGFKYIDFHIMVYVVPSLQTRARARAQIPHLPMNPVLQHPYQFYSVEEGRD